MHISLNSTMYFELCTLYSLVCAHFTVIDVSALTILRNENNMMCNLFTELNQIHFYNLISLCTNNNKILLQRKSSLWYAFRCAVCAMCKCSNRLSKILEKKTDDSNDVVLSKWTRTIFESCVESIRYDFHLKQLVQSVPSGWYTWPILPYFRFDKEEKNIPNRLPFFLLHMLNGEFTANIALSFSYFEFGFDAFRKEIWNQFV